IVVISEVLEHVEEDGRVLEMASNLLGEKGLLLLTVPNIDRFINRVVVVLGRNPYFMSEDHLREYSLPCILDLLRRAGFSAAHLTPVYFRLAKELCLRRRLVRLTNPIRNFLLLLFPRFSTYYLILARKGRQDSLSLRRSLPPR